MIFWSDLGPTFFYFEKSVNLTFVANRIKKPINVFVSMLYGLFIFT